MARNITLRELIDMVREESGHSTHPGVGQADTDRIAALLRRTQRRLYLDFDWPHLYTEVEEPLAKGARYYGYQVGVDQERIRNVYAESLTGDWVPVQYGIDPTLYNILDSENDEQEDPVRYWMMRDNSTYEVWPIPASDNLRLKFTGLKELPALKVMEDRCVLDADLLVMYVSAELLARQKSPDAEYKIGLADQHYRRLRAATQHRDMINFNGRTNDTRLARQQQRYARGPRMG